MTDQDELQDRIADLLWRTEEKSWEDQAQAIIDEFGMTVRGDDCGYHEIHGSYDTRFGDH